MTFNKLPGFLRQITNDQRQNSPSIKVHPVDSGADVETADIIQGMIRHIEYESNADVAYDTAVNSAAACGRGYFRLITDYESETSFNQVIRFKRERNPLNVYIDPFSQEPDGSDMRWAFIVDTMPKSEFKRKYPKSDISSSNFDTSVLGAHASHWLQGDAVIVAEYYRVEEIPATLLMLSDGSTGFDDEFNAELAAANGITVIGQRQSTKRTVKWAKITGADVLEQTDILCKWIPVFPVAGDELDIEGKVVRRGMVRDAKDPARMYNFWMTTATEEVALRPKTPFVGAEGQFEVDKGKWASANVKSYPYIQYKPVTVNGTLAPAPQRQPMADVPVGVLNMAAHANEDIKSITGIFDASLGARSNETSGKAILARQREGDVSNFHFADNLNRAVRHAGRCIVDMLPHYYDTERVVRVRGEDEEMSAAKINVPTQDEQGVDRVLHDMSAGQYDVTITAGPSYTTQRQEAAESMAGLAQAWPKLMDIAGDEVIGSQDWPGSDKIAERIKRTIPPQITGDDEDGGPSVPPQVQAQLQQMQQVMQEQQQKIQEYESGMAKAQLDADTKIRVAQINAKNDVDVQEIKSMVDLLLKKMDIPPPLAAAVNEQGLSPASAGFLLPDDSVPPGTQATSGAFPDDDSGVIQP